MQQLIRRSTQRRGQTQNQIIMLRSCWSVTTSCWSATTSCWSISVSMAFPSATAVPHRATASANWATSPLNRLIRTSRCRTLNHRPAMTMAHRIRLKIIVRLIRDSSFSLPQAAPALTQRGRLFSRPFSHPSFSPPLSP